MHRLVLDLLDLARMDSGIAAFERSPLDLVALLQSVVDKMKHQARTAGVEISLETTSLPEFLGDGDRLAQVITNLIDNAIQHTPAGGRVLVRAGHSGEQVEVAVVDSGEGIPPQELERIFERFYQLDKSRPGDRPRGAGLGLAIAREIIQAYNGTLVAFNNTNENIPGQGCTFVVKLPLAPPTVR